MPVDVSETEGLDLLVTQIYPILCKGRNAEGNEVLAEPIVVDVTITKGKKSNGISSWVRCPYNTGGHGQRCKASHPNVDKVGDGVCCPYTLEVKNRQ